MPPPGETKPVTHVEAGFLMLSSLQTRVYCGANDPMPKLRPGEEDGS